MNARILAAVTAAPAACSAGLRRRCTAEHAAATPPTAPARPQRAGLAPTPSTREQQKQVVHRRVGRKFKAQTGAEGACSRRSPRANDELTKIQTSVLSGQGPDIYSLGTTFTPTAYATGAFVELSADDWTKIGGRDQFLPATLGISGPDASHEVGIPFTSRPFVMAYNKDLLAAAGIDKPADSWDGLLDAGQEADQGRHLRPGDRLRRRLRPVEVHLGDEHAGRQPAGRRRQGARSTTRRR